MLYRDRSEAGRQLAELLSGRRLDDPLVLALPRGGVVVGYEIARRLRAPLDVLVVRKLGAPMNPEFGFGAVAPGGLRLLDERTVRALGLTGEQIEAILQAETAELERRSRVYRGDRPQPQLNGKTVILVDDGLATGGTARAAIRAVRQGGPGRLILAVPVAPTATADELRREVDDFVCPAVKADFRAIGEWYHRFDQNTDRQVVALLERNREEMGRRDQGDPGRPSDK
jgi:putative phosphoribosyl transferase